MKSINITFVDVDFWGRPVFKVEDMEVYFGSVDIIFPNEKIAPNRSVEEIVNYFRENTDKLVIFGSKFDDDPLGTPIKKDIKINVL